MEQKQPHIYISPSRLPSYDFKTAAEAVPSGPLRDIFLRHESGLNSSDPDARWTAVDSMKVIARQNMMSGIQQYRQATLGILEQAIAKDPDAGVRQKAEQTASLIRHMGEPEIVEP